MVRAAFVLVLLVAGMAASGCRGSSDAGLAAKPLPPAYRALLDEVAALRELPAPETLRIGVVPRERVREVLATAATTEEPAAARRTSIYTLLGLLDDTRGYDEAWEESVAAAAAAFYLPGRRELWLVLDGELPADPSDLPPWLRRALVHELVHALQDFAFDIAALERRLDSFDARLALWALLEGDAVRTESAWTAARLLPTLGAPGDLDPPTAPALQPALAREARFLYGAGHEYTAHLAQGAESSINRLLEAGGPGSTAIVLHPELEATGWRRGGASLPPGVPAAGWSASADDRLGEFLLGSYLQSGLPALVAIQAAAGWSDDVARLYRGPTGEPAMAVRVTFRDQKEAGEFVGALRALLEAQAVEVRTEPGAMTGLRRDGVTMGILDTQDASVTFVMATRREDALALGEYLRNR